MKYCYARFGTILQLTAYLYISRFRLVIILYYTVLIVKYIVLNWVRTYEVY